ncbi:hypothetical protein PACTADRAFT_50219 [Pachysolen tannophilus NRRL Y-2460]|uniref:TRUD domain-containing protein n=1 Tax=Pachysolen tannophilus NRRL Y-2460 TaxID=669874 RepID=A0A1E4TUU0_PACTA|nr:hypothetical protein PACTADRAFT_50219 [Pachysolen tannophilus NRRL Y-2460]
MSLTNDEESAKRALADEAAEAVEGGLEAVSNKRIKLEHDGIADQNLKGIQEEDVGICQYISPSIDGFHGILKQRYTDFLVNEIGMDGKVVYLVDEGFPNSKDRRKERRLMDQKQNSDNVNNDKIDELLLKEEEVSNMKQPKYELKAGHRIELLNFFGEEDLNKIEELFNTGNHMETSKSFDDKATRSKIHKLLREAFQNKLESLTTDSNTLKVALAVKSNRNNRRRNNDHIENGDGSNNSSSGNSNNGKKDGDPNYGLGPIKDHLILTMYKENKETMEVASLLAKFLRIPTKWIRYAGTKDRRGITVQKLSIERLRVDRVNNLNRILKGIRIGSFNYSDTGLSLGNLKGNEFVITIKEVEPYDKSKNLEKLAEDSFKTLKEIGFINYYGMQRFGTFSISTHQIGVKLLQNKWKEAAELLLSDQDLVAPDSVEARQIWKKTRNASLALKKMPRRFSAEFAILKVLEKEKLDDNGDYNDHSYFQGVMQIPRNLRIMYGHAYQSYVWNCVASKRIELFGLQIVEGDLVIIDENIESIDQLNQEDAEDEFVEDIRKNTFIRARPVTTEDIESKKYSIYDVVLPTPGFDVLYPSNPKLKQVYIDIMSKDNLDPFQMSRKVREFSLAGSYRSLIGKVGDLSYYIRHYSNNDESLVLSDLDILRKRQDFEKKKLMNFSLKIIKKLKKWKKIKKNL